MEWVPTPPETWEQPGNIIWVVQEDAVKKPYGETILEDADGAWAHDGEYRYRDEAWDPADDLTVVETAEYSLYDELPCLFDTGYVVNGEYLNR
jgi:hypothetical protein